MAADPIVNLGAGGLLEATSFGSVIDAAGCVWFPGQPDDYLEAAHQASLAIPGDLEITARVAVAVPTGSPDQQSIISSWMPADQWFDLSARDDGKLRLQWSTTGADTLFADSTVDWSPGADLWIWVKATLEIDDGGVWRVIFYTAADQIIEPAIWVQLGATIAGGAPTSIHPSTSPVSIGGRHGIALQQFGGRISDVALKPGLAAIPVLELVGATDIPTDPASSLLELSIGPLCEVHRTTGAGLLSLVLASNPVVLSQTTATANRMQVAASPIFEQGLEDDLVRFWVGELGNTPALNGFMFGPGANPRSELQWRNGGRLRAFTNNSIDPQVVANLDPVVDPAELVLATWRFSRSQGKGVLEIYGRSGLLYGSTVDLSAITTVLDASTQRIMDGGSLVSHGWMVDSGPGVADLWSTADLLALAKYLIEGVQTPAIAYKLAAMAGVWMPGRARIPQGPWPFLGCEISDGYGLAVEVFYNPDASARRFGEGTFGSDQFGQFAGAAPTEKRWVDLTPTTFNARSLRGQQDPTINQPVDELDFSILDPDGDVVGWRPPAQLGSPNINDPCRISVIDQLGEPTVVTWVRLNSLEELHGGSLGQEGRTIEVVGYGLKTDLIEGIIDPARLKETTAQRIDFALAAIDFTDPVEAYPAIFATRDLAADTHERSVQEAQAYTLIQEAAASANHYVHTDRTGQLVWREIANLDPAPAPQWVISDCAGSDEDVVYADGLYTADTTEILNVVQLVNAMLPAENVQAEDLVSIAKWGRQSRGFGFPLRVVNDKQTDAQAIADAYVAQTANVVNRVKWVTFDTNTDPRWWQFLLELDISLEAIIRRTGPNGIEDFTARLIGVDISYSTTGITGQLFMSTRSQTF